MFPGKMFCLFHGNDLYLGSFAEPEGYVIAEYLVLNGILQGSLVEHFHNLPLDEAHLYDPLAETSVTLDLDDAVLPKAGLSKSLTGPGLDY